MIRTLGKVDEQVLCEIKEEMKIRATHEIFLLFALGSQFDHLIKQCLERSGIFCLVADPARVSADDVKKVAPIGIILSGGPVSVYKDPPPFDKNIFDLGIPVLGICLGFQLWAQHIGCMILGSEKREFGVHKFYTKNGCCLFTDCPAEMSVLESHGDRVEKISDSRFKVLGSTENAPISAARYEHLWGVQFHPEVSHTKYGRQIFDNFCFGICRAKTRFPANKVTKEKIFTLSGFIKNRRILLALSGGSDSSVTAYILKEALSGEGRKFRGVYIKGVDRPDDEAHVLKYFDKQNWISLIIVDATQNFLDALRGKKSGHEKRVAVREVYKQIIEEEVERFQASLIAQGTLYTDISESGGGYESGSQKAQIKLHHNVGLGFSKKELLPLSDQVKDTARELGRSIGVPEELLTRHPFPGPGLVVRIEGEITSQKLRIARHLDDIYIEELRKTKLYEKVWQAGVELTNSVTTCTKGDDAVSGMVAVMWAVWSVNGFTAEAAQLPWDFIKRVSQRMVNEVKEIGGVCYRVSDKPPTTIEWE